MIIMMAWTNARIRYIISYIVFCIVYFFLIPLVTIPIEIFKKGNVHSLRVNAVLCTSLMRILGLELHVRGSDNMLKLEGPVIIVVNHQTSWDLLFLCAAGRELSKVSTVVKKEILYAGLLGIYCWLLSFIFLQRSGSASERNSFSQQVQRLLREKYNVLIFVEGTRGGSGRNGFLPFKKGAFHSAISNKVPVVPCVMSPQLFIKNKQWNPNSGKVIVEFLPRISTKGMKMDGVEKLSSVTKDAMEKCYKKHYSELCHRD